MKQRSGRFHSSSRTSDVRAVRPGWWLVATALVAMLLVEVWEGSRVAQLSLALGQDRKALEETRGRLAYVGADLERRTTRAETAPLAAQLGLAPAEAQQVIALPSSYLAAETIPTRDGEPASALGLAERASRALVPEATARVRDAH